MTKVKAKGSVWHKMQGYASGGEVDEEPEDDTEEEAPTAEQPLVNPKSMQELAAHIQRLAPGDASTTQPTITQENRVPASNKESATDIRKKVQDFINKQAGGSDNMQKLADLQREQLARAGNQHDMSALNALTDHLYGTSFAKQFAPPPTALQQTEKNMEAQEAVNKSRQPVTADLIKEYASDNNAATKEQANYYRGLNSSRANGEKEEKNLDMAEEHMAKAMNPMSSVYGTGGSNLGQRLARARSVTALIRQHPNYDLDPREQKDMALSVAALLSNQNRVPYELVQSLVPKTWRGTLAGWGEYVANHPESTESQDFVKRMMQTVSKEQQTAEEQIRAIQGQQAEGFNHLAVKRPDRYQAHLKAASNYLSMPNLDQLPGANPDPKAKPEMTPDISTPPVEGARLKRKKSTGEVWWETKEGKKIPVGK